MRTPALGLLHTATKHAGGDSIFRHAVGRMEHIFKIIIAVLKKKKKKKTMTLLNIIVFKRCKGISMAEITPEKQGGCILYAHPFHKAILSY